MIRKRRSQIRDYQAEARLFASRAIVAFIGIVVLMGALVANMYNIQVNQFQDYQTRSNDNRIKVVPIAPNRGLIYDRNGVLLAENRPVFNLELTPEKKLKTLMQPSKNYRLFWKLHQTRLNVSTTSVNGLVDLNRSHCLPN